MAQLTVYIDEKTLKKIGFAAQAERSSISQWVKSRLTCSLESSWPEGYFNLFGRLKKINLKRPSPLKLYQDIDREKL